MTSVLDNVQENNVNNQRRRKLEDSDEEEGENILKRSKSSKKSKLLDAAEEMRILQQTTRTGGVYLPPAKLKELQAQIKTKSGEAYQRLTWDALKKSINGLINKVNVANIKNVIVELFGENLIRGKGLFARSILKAQFASPMFTPVYAALVAVLNTKLPALGSLVLHRLVSNFQKGYRRNDKSLCISSTKFIAHLVNQQVAHEIVALEILALLLERPTDDSVEVAVAFVKEVGAFLSEVSPKATHATFERFRSILHEAQIDKRIQYMVEVLFQVRKDKFKDNLTKSEGLDLVEEEDQITHYISLEDTLETEEQLDVFKFDPEFEENEKNYDAVKHEILGSSDEEEDGSEREEDEEEMAVESASSKTLKIQDETQTNLINFRRTIYLTMKSSLDFEEACHKLLKMHLAPGQERHLASMVIESCSQERSYDKYFGFIGERLCKMNKIWADCFSTEFANLYQTIHRYEVNRIRNISKFFGYLLSSDALPWTVLAVIKLTEEDTTSSSRIMVKILFEDLLASLGSKVLKERMIDEFMQGYFTGLFPTDDPKNVRFAINYFTSIGLGFLTDSMRERLKFMPKQIASAEVGSSSDSSDYSSSEEE